MAENVNLVSVKVLVNGKEQTIQMEKGVSFENKGGIYNVDENGALKKFDKTKNLWADASSIEMRSYQWKAFNNVANNDGNAKTYTKADIEKAKEYYSQGKFRADMAQDLPEGYKIEKASKPDVNALAVRVSNGKDSQSATLKFSFIDTLSNLTKADKKSDANAVVKTEIIPRHEGYENVTKKTYADGSYSFEKIFSRDVYFYEEYYSNGKKKLEIDKHDTAGLVVKVFDDRGNILYDEGFGMGCSDHPEEFEQKYDAKGRIIYSDSDFGVTEYKYDDNNKTITEINGGVHTKYKMDENGEIDCETGALSEVYIGKTGRKIDLMNNGVEKLLQELNIKCKFADDTYRLAE